VISFERLGKNGRSDLIDAKWMGTYVDIASWEAAGLGSVFAMMRRFQQDSSHQGSDAEIAWRPQPI